MTRWPTKPLSEVAQVTAGNPAPQRAEDFSDDGAPFVRMQDVGRFGQTTCLVETKDRLSASASSKFKRFPVGSILVPKSGASIRLNHRAILGVEAHVVSHLAVIIPHASLNTHFAYYWLCGIDLSAVAHNADMPSMKTSELAKLQIPVPPLVEQERIVNLLDEAGELRKLRSQADQCTTALIPALFEEMFGESTTNRKRWQMTPLAELISDGPQNGLYKHSSFYGEGIPILRIDAFYDGEIEDLSALKRLRATPEEIKRYTLHEHDFVINRVNSPEYLGKSALIPALPEPTVFESNMMRFSVLTKLVEPGYLIRFLQTPTAKQHVLGRAKHSINQSSINQEDVKCLPVPVPPLPLQKEFAQRVTEIRELEIRQAASRTRLDALFQSMLHRAFNGEL